MIGRLLVSALVVALICPRPLCAHNARLSLQRGVYQNLAVAVSRDVSQPLNFIDFLETIKQFITDGSEALNYATEELTSFGDFTLVIPRTWNASELGYGVQEPTEDITIENSDILFYDDDDALPGTLQHELCGVPAQQIRVPTRFLSLSEDDVINYGTQGQILAHEWAHYRWGVHDEHGYPDDDVYPAHHETETATSCIAGDMPGTWKTNCATQQRCSPEHTTSCYYCVDDTVNASVAMASLGYMPALSNGKFCTADTHDKGSPSKHNQLCAQLSITEVIQRSSDYENMEENVPSPDITVNIQPEPIGRVVLLFGSALNEAENETNVQILDALKDVVLEYDYPRLGMMVHSTVDNVTHLDVLRQPDFVNESSYNELYGFLPDVGTGATNFGEVLEKILEKLDGYDTGTLLVMKVTVEDTNINSGLDKDIALQLRERRIKPILLYPNNTENLAPVTSFLQWSAGRLTMNSTHHLPSEVKNFLSNTFEITHPIVMYSEYELEPSQSIEHVLYYQSDVVQSRLAVITSSQDITELEVKIKINGALTDCFEKEKCTFAGNSIVFYYEETWFPAPGQLWFMTVTNNLAAQSAQITTTFSEMLIRGQSQELDVEVWTSESQGPAGDVPTNKQIVAYISVSNYGYQVLETAVDISATVEINGIFSPSKLEFVDDGTDVDLIKDDSVYSARIPLEEGAVIEAGTQITISDVVLQGSQSETNAQQTHIRDKLFESSGLYSRNPAEVPCCGSYVKNPSVSVGHVEAGYNLFMPGVQHTAEVSRNLTISVYIQSTTTTSTTTTSTTTPTVTTGRTTEQTTSSSPTQTSELTTPSTAPSVITSTTVKSTTVSTSTTDDASSIHVWQTLTLSLSIFALRILYDLQTSRLL